MARAFHLRLGFGSSRALTLDLADGRGLSDALALTRARALTLDDGRGLSDSPVLSLGGATPTAPTGKYASGTQVGVPTGTTLTTRAGNSLGASNAPDETITLTHPQTGAQQTLTVQVYRRLQWTDTLQKGAVPQDTHILFDECKFAPAGSAYFCVDFETWFEGRTDDIMKPVGIFRRCTFDGGFHTGKGLAMHRYWLIQSELYGSEDGCIGGAYSVVVDSNVQAAINWETAPGGDPHPDGWQMTDTGHALHYRSWYGDSGLDGFYLATAAIGIGTQFGPTTDVGIYYCTFEGAFNQTIGARGGGYGGTLDPVTNLRIVGNRWRDNGTGFHYDFQANPGGEQMIAEWSDNSRAIDGTREGVFYPAGYVLNTPGV